jgi:hypothetical protein
VATLGPSPPSVPPSKAKKWRGRFVRVRVPRRAGPRWNHPVVYVSGSLRASRGGDGDLARIGAALSNILCVTVLRHSRRTDQYRAGRVVLGGLRPILASMPWRGDCLRLDGSFSGLYKNRIIAIAPFSPLFRTLREKVYRCARLFPFASLLPEVDSSIRVQLLPFV